MTYTHVIKVRYGECDMQKVVFNANYWAYCDDAVDHWIRTSLAQVQGIAIGTVEITDLGFDFMLKACTGTWHRAITFGETVSALCAIERWGTTSFDVKVDMQVDDVSCFVATITYVSVGVDSRAPSPVPEFVREALSPPSQ